MIYTMNFNTYLLYTKYISCPGDYIKYNILLNLILLYILIGVIRFEINTHQMILLINQHKFDICIIHCL